MTENSIKKALKEADPDIQIHGVKLTSMGYMIKYSQMEMVTTTVTIHTLRELNELYRELKEG